MASIPLVNAIVFAAYGQAKSFLRDSGTVSGSGVAKTELLSLSSHHQHTLTMLDNPDEPLNLWQLALAGSWAGFVNSFVVSPVELVKTRLQIQYNAPTSFFGTSSAKRTPLAVHLDHS